MIDQWNGCYDIGWQGEIIPEAFAHPAKFSRGLIHRIYKHALEMGWVKPGDYILDPFGGVALGGLDALSMGLNWIGVELEEKFVSLGQQNIELWNRQLKGWPNLGTARIVQGDSRRLRDVIKETSLIVSSPPYSERHSYKDDRTVMAVEKLKAGSKGKNIGGTRIHDNVGNSEGQLGQMPEGNFQDVIEKADLVVSSPPFCDQVPQQDPNFQAPHDSLNRRRLDYGHTPGNLANMKEGDIDMVVGSPPFVKVDCKKAFTQEFLEGQRISHPGRSDKALKKMMDKWNGLPESPGQLGSMKEGSFDLITSSPPYEGAFGNRQHEGDQTKYVKRQEAYRLKHPEFKRPKGESMAYPASKGNLGSEYGDTFWSASHEIVQQCYELLKDGSHAIFVTKNYVKNKKIVPFTDRWLSLCESVGFKLVCRHQAMLIRKHGIQTTIHGDEVIETQRKSFFRRLAESKGSPRIDEEDILCMEKKCP